MKMKKRAKKKLGNRYNVLKRAKREKSKRRGCKCIDYSIVPMGITDKSEFNQEGYGPEYPYATHWFAQLVYSKEKFPIYNTNDKYQYILTVYPCNKRGGTHTESAVRIILFEAEKLERITSFFREMVNDMEKDCFWNAAY